MHQLSRDALVKFVHQLLEVTDLYLLDEHTCKGYLLLEALLLEGEELKGVNIRGRFQEDVLAFDSGLNQCLVILHLHHLDNVYYLGKTLLRFVSVLD